MFKKIKLKFTGFILGLTAKRLMKNKKIQHLFLKELEKENQRLNEKAYNELIKKD